MTRNKTRGAHSYSKRMLTVFVSDKNKMQEGLQREGRNKKEKNQKKKRGSIFVSSIKFGSSKHYKLETEFNEMFPFRILISTRSIFPERRPCEEAGSRRRCSCWQGAKKNKERACDFFYFCLLFSVAA